MQIKNKKWKMLLMLFFASLLMITFFDLLPRLSVIGQMAVSLYEKNDRVKKEMESEEQYKALVVENRMLKSEVKSSLSGYSGNDNISSVIALLDSVSHLSQVRISSIKPEKAYKKDNLLLQPIEVNIVTKYERAYNYIRFLEKAKKVVMIKELSIASKEESKDSLIVKACLEVYLNL